ncbi:hypothetical protein N7462_006323 [Penicillium macrosclerotiorum]|uniref:uncharacterized protein n=1 Tax=Penicillium macrosclerotiorum TaxID=303699 RepID=UPI00254765B8|nr:uncharacterized protein N7462_006323 [Penicillium macrosclerotiorum]KAJ5683158.1 hypothetical protein N7462_006323 [Penicillium macrosclerotiorum]
MGRPRSPRDVESNHKEDVSYTWREWAAVLTWSVLGYLSIILMVIGYFNPSLLPIDPTSLVFNKDISPFFAFSRGSGHFPKPRGLKIVALVPFNYHERTEILDCYLQKNLVHNHGFLDQVVFIPQTEDPVSLEWLNSLIRQTPEYAISPPGQDMDWKIAQDNVMYIRIDGDVVFLEDHTIPTIVKTKLENPNSIMVSANVVNEAALSSLHSHPGVAFPYLPELQHVKQPARSKSQLSHDWRASSLPRWQGPASFRVRKGFKPPFQGHRWLLPIESGSDRDPIAASVYTETGPTLKDWTVSAQQHYSFLDHLESNTLEKYKFPLWVEPTEPISQNFGCFWGNDAETLRKLFMHSSDEDFSKSWIAPDGTRPHVSIDGKGLVSHYSASLGVSGLDSTDLLERYRAYAEEKVCRPTF